jgi:hypothetical protein
MVAWPGHVFSPSAKLIPRSLSLQKISSRFSGIVAVFSQNGLKRDLDGNRLVLETILFLVLSFVVSCLV